MHPRRDTNESGVVYVEFLIAFVPVFLFFLAILQFALLSAAQVVVRHAAVRGVRAAVVILDDDPARYGNGDRGALNTVTSTQDDWEQTLANRLGGGGPGSELPAQRLNHGGERMGAIARAVFVPISAIVPEPGQIQGLMGTQAASVAAALGGAPLTRLFYGLLFHAGVSTSITFPVSPGSEDLHAVHVPPDAPVTLRVTHLFHCGVPLAASFLCQPPTGADLARLANAPGSHLHPLLAASRGRFALLEAEATLPSHSAPYLYASQVGSP